MAAIEIDRSPEMLRQYWIIENYGKDAVRVLHVVTKDRKEKGAYAELKSLNGFRRRCTKRMSAHYDKDIRAFHARQATDPSARMVYTSPAVWYDVRDSTQWQIDTAVREGMHAAVPASPLWADVPVVEAGGVFDMYALIGYDHRADRYTAPTPAPLVVGELVNPV